MLRSFGPFPDQEFDMHAERILTSGKQRMFWHIMKYINLCQNINDLITLMKIMNTSSIFVLFGFSWAMERMNVS